MFSPLDQFEIFGIDFDCYIFRYIRDNDMRWSVQEDFTEDCELIHYIHEHAFYAEKFFVHTNSTIYHILCCSSLYFLISIANSDRPIYKMSSWHYFNEKIFLIFKGIVEQNFEERFWAQAYFPFLYTIFFFILLMNVLGLVPFGFTNTSFIVETFTLSASMLIGLTILAIYIQGNDFFAHFVPKGIPVGLIPMLVIIEVISYVSKAFSLSIRLFANLMSGHTLLNILSSFSISLGKISIIIGLVPFIIVVSISFLEVGIALLQAYVFMILLTLYFNDTCKTDHNFIKENREFSIKNIVWHYTDKEHDLHPQIQMSIIEASNMKVDLSWGAFYEFVLPIQQRYSYKASDGGVLPLRRVFFKFFYHKEDYLEEDFDYLYHDFFVFYFRSNRFIHDISKYISIYGIVGRDNYEADIIFHEENWEYVNVEDSIDIADSQDAYVFENRNVDRPIYKLLNYSAPIFQKLTEKRVFSLCEPRREMLSS